MRPDHPRTPLHTWQDKFVALCLRHYQHGGDGAAPKVPFGYYRESMAAMSTLLHAHASSDDDETAIEAEMRRAVELWARYKLPPRGLPSPPARRRQPPVVVAEQGITLLHPLGWTCDCELDGELDGELEPVPVD